ncbi:hypothetical protein BpHYR1_042886 [Brachionus plicatilis]|uniref:Uncharacterized protein n=1 Tax=Brachionus plicatilis TaxID=10195 RepID=A0A3M7RKK5_BRAPC|nr:hypothetical protein BpHYR1_042886 [Brachionus plicatilis]
MNCFECSMVFFEFLILFCLAGKPTENSFSSMAKIDGVERSPDSLTIIESLSSFEKAMLIELPPKSKGEPSGQINDLKFFFIFLKLWIILGPGAAVSLIFLIAYWSLVILIGTKTSDWVPSAFLESSSAWKVSLVEMWFKKVLFCNLIINLQFCLGLQFILQKKIFLKCQEGGKNPLDLLSLIPETRKFSLQILTHSCTSISLEIVFAQFFNRVQIGHNQNVIREKALKSLLILYILAFITIE